MTYQGYYVFDVRPLKSPEPGMDFLNEYVLVGNQIQQQAKYSHKLTERTLKFSYLQSSATEREWYRRFFDSYKGRYGKFWVPSWKRDYSLAVAAAPGASQFRCVQAFRSSALRGYKRHLYIPTDSSLCTKIQAVSSNLGEEVITINPYFVNGLVIVGEIMDLYLCRFDDDSFRCEMVDNGAWSQVQFSFQELQKETP
uniref:Uncharacterized protein n=1 Tax=viral metagenome TaxID=1070528 RepID=A0A6M3L1H0_9ZZZZ